MKKLRELEIELNYIRWRKGEYLYTSEFEKAAEFREKENNLLMEMEQFVGSEYLKTKYMMICFEGKYYEYPLDAKNDEEALRMISIKINATKKLIDKVFNAKKMAAKAAMGAAESAAAMFKDAAYTTFPIVSEYKKIIWKNVFRHYPVPGELSNAQVKEWSYQILNKLKEIIPAIPLDSVSDPVDEKILSGLCKKYNLDIKSFWVEIDILKKIVDNTQTKSDNEIFFLLYRLLEK